MKATNVLKVTNKFVGDFKWKVADNFLAAKHYNVATDLKADYELSATLGLNDTIEYIETYESNVAKLSNVAKKYIRTLNK